MFTATFYSYKGGVGRTLALMNVAARLASNGKRVFLLDFDLEAPGLDAFEESQKQPTPGLVEYISEFFETDQVPELSGYTHEVTLENIATPIRIMSAGRKDKEYQRKLGHLDWKVLYAEREGYLFVENLLEAIRSQYAPDYLLVDSRTGLTDISGICTLQLPDLVVLLFNLNNQNVEGISKVYKSIKENKLGRSIETVLVATPIPDVASISKLKSARLERATKAIGAEIDFELPHDPSVAFAETIVAGSVEGSALGKQYDSLATGIAARNPEDIVYRLERGHKAFNVGQWGEALRWFSDVARTNPELDGVWLSLARTYKNLGKDVESLKALYTARSLRPGESIITYQLAFAELQLGNYQEAEKRLDEYLTQSKDAEGAIGIGLSFMNRGLVDAASRAFNRANEIKPDPNSYHGLGVIKVQQQDLLGAADAFKRAKELTPHSLVHTYNYAWALNQTGRKEEAQANFQRAVVLYETGQGRKQPSNANLLQAMSFAYEVIGDFEKAVNCLRTAVQIASEGSAETYFSAVQYRDISKEQFISECEDRLSELTGKIAGTAN